MHLKSIKIRNFRCFEDLTVNFEDDLTVFVAVNGGGKTTLTDAIAAAFVAVVWRLTEARQKLLSLKDLRRQQDRSRSAELVIRASTADGLTWETPLKFVDVSDEDHLFDTDWAPLQSTVPKFKAIQQSVAKDAKSEILVPVVAYYRSTRNLAKAPKVSETNRQFPRLDVWKTALDAVASYQDVIDWFHAKEVEELRTNRDHPATPAPLPDLDCVRRAVTTVLEPAEAIYFTATTPAKPALRWRDNGEAGERLISQLSDGYRNMLALVMDFARRLAQANPQMENPLAAEAIMIVDEIDLHLHPKWQQTILGDLRKTFPNTQLIVTTHSPQVLTTVESRCIRVLDNGQVRAAPPASSGAESSRLLERIMGVCPAAPLGIPTPKLLSDSASSSQMESWRRDEAPSAYTAVTTTLDRDQGGLCAYCEFDLVPGTEQAVEHFHPKSDRSGGRNWHLVWENLLLCCRGGQGWAGEQAVVDGRVREPRTDNLSCDARKGSQILDGTDTC